MKNALLEDRVTDLTEQETQKFNELKERIDQLQPEELKEFSQLARKKAEFGKVMQLNKDLKEMYTLQEGRVFGIPHYMEELLSVLCSFQPGTSSRDEVTRTTKSPKKERGDTSNNIRDLILDYIDSHPREPKSGIKLDTLYQKIPEILDVAKSQRAATPYIRGIAKKPDSRISYDEKTRLISVAELLTYDRVKEIGNRLISGSYATTKAIAKELGPKVYMPELVPLVVRWASQYSLESKVTRTKEGIETVYWNKDTQRPPISPLELLNAVMGEKKEIFYKDALEQTGLSRRSLSGARVSAKYQVRGKGESKEIIRP